MTPEERAEWIRFYMEERIAEGYSTLEAQSYAVRQLERLEERQDDVKREKWLKDRKNRGQS